MVDIKAPGAIEARPANWRLAQHQTAEFKKIGAFEHPNWGTPMPELGQGWFKNNAQVDSPPVKGERFDLLYLDSMYQNRVGDTWKWDKRTTAFKPLGAKWPWNQ